MKKIVPIASCVVCLLTGCSPRPIPESEKLLGTWFDKLNIALQYEVICENSKHTESMNPNLPQNARLITLAYMEELAKNYPDKSKAERDMMMAKRRDWINAQMAKAYKEKGCASDMGKESAKLLDVLLQTDPAETPAIIKAQIKEVEDRAKGVPLAPRDKPATPPETR